MPIRIAEYLGQSVDSKEDIIPSFHGGTQVPSCPFTGSACSKMNSSDPKHPICSVRRNKELFVVCSDRTVSAKANVLSPDQIITLKRIGAELFPDATPGQIAYKRQIGMALGRTRLYLDYCFVNTNSSGLGKSRVILEIQGGGETSNTGTITRHVNEWMEQEQHTNVFLSKPLAKVGIIPNNAWKRQLDQILQKSHIANNFGGGFAIAMGKLLFEYVRQSVTVGREYHPEWEIALISLDEDSDKPGSQIRFLVDQAIFMSRDEFLSTLTASELPKHLANPFHGKYATLTNKAIEIE